MSVQRIHVSPDSERHDSVLRKNCIKFAYVKRQHISSTSAFCGSCTSAWKGLTKTDSLSVRWLCSTAVVWLYGVTGLGQLLIFILLSVQIHTS